MGRRKRDDMRWDPDLKNNKWYKHQPPRYTALNALVTSKPRHECSIFGNEIREEVVVTGILYRGNSADTYIIRFIHKNCLELARKLVPGIRIRVEKGRYEYRKGRQSAEFQVKYFSLADDSIRASEQPTLKFTKNLELVFNKAWKIEVRL